MENKYCERCGVFLGLVNPCKKYCEECRIAVRRERQALAKKGIKTEPEPALCAWCKKPMVRKVWSQKYHPECAADANKALTKKHKAKKQKELKELKAHPANSKSLGMCRGRNVRNLKSTNLQSTLCVR